MVGILEVKSIIKQKGFEMSEMTPEQVALDNNIKQTDTIRGLQEGQADIVKALTSSEKHTQEAFDKGDAKFTNIENEIEEMKIEVSGMKGEVSEMKTQLSDGFKQISHDINEHIIKSGESEIANLNKKLDRKAQMKDGVIVTLVGGILLAIASKLILASVVGADVIEIVDIVAK